MENKKKWIYKEFMNVQVNLPEVDNFHLTRFDQEPKLNYYIQYNIILDGTPYD